VGKEERKEEKKEVKKGSEERKAGLEGRIRSGD
jgi:hypothetical protein